MPQDNQAGPLRPTPRYEHIIAAAQDLARAMGHGHVGAEHLFLAIIRDRAALPTQALSRSADPAELHRDVLAYLQESYGEPFRETPAYPEQYVPDFTGAEQVWLPRGDLDDDLVGALVSALPAGAAFGFNFAGDRAWIQVGSPGDSRSVLSAARQALGRGQA
jgi:Clp amino terminal domain, pathogenicity island component